MKQRIIGSIAVSEVGMGCMGFSHGYRKVPEEAYSIRAIQKAYDFGCTFFDTVENYGVEQFFAGHNEQLVGRAVEGFRGNVVLTTKFHLHPGDYGPGVSLYDTIRGHMEASLRNLRTNHIDLYYLHRINEMIPVEEVAEVMGRLKQEGCIRGWGLSQISVPVLKATHSVTPVSAVQNLYSMLERDGEQEIIPYCLDHHIGVVPFSSIVSGFLSGNVTVDMKFEGDNARKFVPQLSKESITASQPVPDILTKFSQRKKVTRAQISPAWILYRHPNVVPIPGSKNQERILENLGASKVLLIEIEFQELEAALGKCTVHGHRSVTESEQVLFGNNWRR